MDLAIYLKVLWRHRKLVGAGVVVAFVLSLVSAARVDLEGFKPNLSHRQDEVWISASTLFVTQEGFPWGRSILDDVIKVGGKNGLPPGYVPRYGDPGRYAGLAQLYAALARSDAVQRNVLRKSRAGARYETEVVKSADNSTVLPLIYMTGYGPSPAAAEAIANRAADAFRSYLARQQAQNGIPLDRRVQVVRISQASDAELFAGRSLVRPAFVFLLVVTIFVALAFVADNAGFTTPRPSAWLRRASPLATSVPRPAEPLASAAANPAEQLARSGPRPTGAPSAEARLSEASAASEEHRSEEPPARVHRWA